MSDKEIKEKKVYKYPKEQIQNYNNTFKDKHKDILITCDICFSTYSSLNKSYHPRSKRHSIAVAILQSLCTTKVNPEKAESAPKVDDKVSV
jgi:hypothetical protein